MLTLEQQLLSDFIRDALIGQRSVREMPMFGGVSFMVDDKMIVAAQKNGDLLVRVDPEQSASLLSRSDTQHAEMGKGRSMGPGWLVAKSPLTDAKVTFWVGIAMKYHAHSS